MQGITKKIRNKANINLTNMMNNNKINLMNKSNRIKKSNKSNNKMKAYKKNNNKISNIHKHKGIL